jgi:hypothetical protein
VKNSVKLTNPIDFKMRGKKHTKKTRAVLKANDDPLYQKQGEKRKKIVLIYQNIGCKLLPQEEKNWKSET